VEPDSIVIPASRMLNPYPDLIESIASWVRFMLNAQTDAKTLECAIALEQVAKQIRSKIVIEPMPPLPDLSDLAQLVQSGADGALVSMEIYPPFEPSKMADVGLISSILTALRQAAAHITDIESPEGAAALETFAGEIRARIAKGQ
jgi:hypothetical protein